MEFPQPLVRGRLIRRYKRFFADVALDEGEVTAHAANPGAMLGLCEPGRVCWLSPAGGAKRTLAWTLELVEADGGAPVMVNTLRPNRLAEAAIDAGAIPELAGYAGLRREVRYGAASRIDLLLEHPDRPHCFVEVKTPSPVDASDARCFVEVKAVSLSREPGLAEWPDCVSSRSSRQLAALADVVAQGDRAVLLFVVLRGDCDRFRVAADLDPTFARNLARATDAGVEAIVYATEVTSERVVITRRLPFV